MLESAPVTLGGRLLLYIGGEAATATVVAGAAAARGGAAAACASGREALLEPRLAEVALAVVDLPLPDVGGDALILALCEHGVPCLVVSGVLKGERYAATAREVGAVGFLEKPFETEALLARLDLVLAPGSPAEGAPVPSGPGVGPLPEWARGLASPAEPEDIENFIFSEARPLLDETPPGLPLRPLLRGLEMPLPAAPRNLSPGPRAPPELREGDLAVTRVTRLLAALHAAGVTGSLTLSRGRLRKLLLLEEGGPVFAASNEPAERFASRCLREGLLSPGALAGLMAEIGPRMPLNEALLARGLIDLPARARLMRDQVRDLIWSTFPWREGSYRVSPGVRARRPIVPVELRVGPLILEGLRRGAVLESLRKELPPSLALVPGQKPALPAGELDLSPPEAAMVAQADGTKSVRDLLRLSGLPERQALAVLQGCLDTGVLDPANRLLSATRRMGFM